MCLGMKAHGPSDSSFFFVFVSFSFFFLMNKGVSCEETVSYFVFRRIFTLRKEKGQKIGRRHHKKLGCGSTDLQRWFHSSGTPLHSSGAGSGSPPMFAASWPHHLCGHSTSVLLCALCLIACCLAPIPYAAGLLSPSYDSSFSSSLLSRWSSVGVVLPFLHS